MERACDGPHRLVIAKRDHGLQIPITSQELEMLKDLVLTGFWGEDVGECAERLLSERLREVVPDRK